MRDVVEMLASMALGGVGALVVFAIGCIAVIIGIAVLASP